MVMSKLQLGHVSLVALSLGLAACGGGSTSNSGGPVLSPGPVPTPTPTPTPTPSTNLSTTDQLNFSAEAAASQASFPTGGTGATGLAASDIDLEIYFTGADYTLTYGDTSMRFNANNIIRTSADETTYQLVDGNTTDTIAMFPLAEHTSPNGPYIYVNAGYWTRSIDGANAIDNETVAFAFGVETSQADFPRTGNAGYYTDIRGSIAFADDVTQYGIFGRGSLVADFASGALTFQGGLQLRRPNYSFVGSPYIYNLSLDGSGTISSSANSFSGDLTISGEADLTGGFGGRFYGPNAAEVGGSFHATGADAAAVGSFLGKIDSRIPGKPTLDALTNPTDISGSLRVIAYSEGEPGTARVVEDKQVATYPAITYSPSTQTYTLNAVSGFFDFYGDGALAVGPAQLAEAQDRPGFVVYDASSDTQVAIFDGTVAGVNLSYASFAEVTSTRSTPVDGVGGYVVLIPFGLRTLPGQMPVTGSASYSGEIFGIANSTGHNTDFVRRLAYTLGGTSSFNVDFSTFTVVGSLNPIGTSIVDGSIRDFGTYTVNGSIGTLQYVVEGDSTSFFDGLFYGPNAEEFGGIFSVITPDRQYELIGATLARQD